MDNADYITLMLMDKGYYDYDYEALKEKAKRHENTEERTQNMAKRFGFGNIRVAGQKAHSADADTQVLDAEALQSEVMEEERKKAAIRGGVTI